MRFKFSCPECSVSDEDNHYELDLKGRGENYPFTCTKGHKFFLIIINTPHELLFDTGIHAFNNRNYRDAVCNFAAALERFYEFGIAVILKEKSSDEVFKENFNSTWNMMSNQTERQLGAYMMLYLLAIQRKPVLLHQNQIKFRNDVVHKGDFPRPEKAKKFGEDVFKLIKAGYSEIHKPYQKSVRYVQTQNVREALNLARKEGKRLKTGIIDTTFSLFSENDLSFDETLNTKKEWNTSWTTTK